MKYDEQGARTIVTQEKTDRVAGSFLHPATGALILGLDWLLFSGTLATGGAALMLAVVLGLTLGGIGTCCIQRFWAKERWSRALMKGVLGGMVVGLPFPIGGTLVGGAVLASSGLDQIRDRAARALAEKATNHDVPRKLEDK